MAQQILVNVYGIKAGKTAPKSDTVYQDAFPTTLKFSPDKLTDVLPVYSRIDYTEGGEQMSAYVAETVAQLTTMANA